MGKLFPWSNKSIATLVCSVLLVFTNFNNASAEWRKDIGIFRIGIITSDKSVEVLDKLEPFKLAISEALDMNVEFFRAKNSTTLINALSDERIEYAIFSASSYALAWATCECIEPVVIPRSKDSGDGYHTVLLSGPDGPKNLTTLNGNQIGILSDNSLTGAPLAKYALGIKNIEIGNDQTPFVKKETAEKTLKAFSNGELKVLIGWSSMTGDPSKGYTRGNLRQLSERFDVSARGYKVLWKSEQIPHRPHVMRKKLHGEAKKILRTTLLNMNKKDPVAYDVVEPVYGGGFVAGRHERFAELISLMQSQASQTPTAEETLPLQ